MGNMISILKISTPFETVILVVAPHRLHNINPAHKDAFVDLEGESDISENTNDTARFLSSVLYHAFLVFEWLYFMTQFVQLPWEWSGKIQIVWDLICNEVDANAEYMSRTRHADKL